MIEIAETRILCGADTENLRTTLKKKICRILRLKSLDDTSFVIRRHSIDCRRKPELYHVFTVSLSLPDKEEARIRKSHIPHVTDYRDKKYLFPAPGELPMPEGERPVVIGAGPAGLFAAYMLALHGYRPLLLERGRSMEERTEDVNHFFAGGPLDPCSNIQFGEGGAGTFSDGKLNTMVNDKSGRNDEVLRIFIECGAPEEIAYEGKPHIGTDRLRSVIVNLRKEIIRLGGDVRFGQQVTGLQTRNNTLCGITVKQVFSENKEEIVVPAHIAVLAPGHSARDTFRELFRENVPMEPKDFAIGFRVLHPQELIDHAQYGTESTKDRESKGLPPSPYKLTARSSSGRGVYSFCMCPGGYVVNASSEPGMLAVNGMSYYDRGSRHANSAIVMTVSKEDYGSDHPLSGIDFQQGLEKKCFALAGGAIPVESFGDFEKRASGPVPDGLSILGAYRAGALHELLPENLTTDFIEGMHAFETKIPGYTGAAAYVAGLESRTSSPVRITRNTQYISTGVEGLYPCGEGAGYAGGIMSAAMDGIRVAEAIASKYRP